MIFTSKARSMTVAPPACRSSSRRDSDAARPDERGFALLVVFLLAAAVALMLYQQMPRVAFETERDKEQLLISRGEQYKRAIQMYVVAYKKYPSKIEDLENTNNHRYLRKRFIDPMTGKDEWRLIHVNGAGQLTDSLVTKPPTPDGKNQDAANASGATGTSGAFGAGSASGASGPPAVNPFVASRPSDRTLAPSNGLQGQPQNIDPNDPRYWPAITLTPSGASGATGAAGVQPGQQFPGQQFPGQQFPGQQLPGQQTGQSGPPLFPGQQLPGQPGTLPPGFQPLPPGQLPGQSPTGQTQGFQNQPTGPSGQQILPVPGLPGQGVNLQSGGIQPTGGVQNPAVGMINDMLRTPRGDQNISATNNNNQVGGGIAGVASTFSGPSIKIYKERQKYNEWEFIFDLKQNMPGGQTGAAAQNPNGLPNQNAQPNASPFNSTIGPPGSPPNLPSKQ
jgi:hypothetical protein